ncbi:prepilin-type N-terminal cleavage/methylation domain-containing protein [Vibrio crassostreae]|uniref:prepilin-type N-terminal cleavage/methylation domain-containing protein n=1 Tax=Vibrio crassostreae TaxID=246167 RepID=UPI000F479E39|nr:prepilin-type N-terminal cleavage/methylation domain-containing protein [Vibrio crassostreae]ROP14534.1 MSHA pilin protein MshA [Vibrio crassostreae]ROP15834.1 MSHA pilin protein MshA [Vibrio crassostreae]RPE90256.1 MSHA pilin protein MshA [Vibrio crassostreae]TCN72508.1 MSHA pilin protein MshA [Vibrio crassostreae]TCV20121.1 MSHA pilin protein MshA [Vibrio crassostreae]
MKRQGGFTLIELVVVIVILGILAVTAAPRFLNLQSDARSASLQGLKGAMAGAAGIVYGTAAINGEETQPTVTAASSASGVNLVFGYPEASANGIGEAVDGLADGGDFNLIPSHVSQAAATVVYGFAGDTATDSTCVVTYTTQASAGAPTITSPDADAC